MRPSRSGIVQCTSCVTSRSAARRRTMGDRTGSLTNIYGTQSGPGRRLSQRLPAWPAASSCKLGNETPRDGHLIFTGPDHKSQLLLYSHVKCLPAVCLRAGSSGWDPLIRWCPLVGRGADTPRTGLGAWMQRRRPRRHPPFWWDVVRRNPGRLTVLALMLVQVFFGEPPVKQVDRRAPTT